MTKILTNNRFVPLAMVGKTAVVTAYDDRSSREKTATTEKAQEWFSFNGTNYVPWGYDNNWPGRSAELVGSIGVLL